MFSKGPATIPMGANWATHSLIGTAALSQIMNVAGNFAVVSVGSRLQAGVTAITPRN